MKTLKYAWRFLIRSKSYTVINLLGLAFSLACCIMLMRYIHRELTVDTHCIDREHVYGVAKFMEYMGMANAAAIINGEFCLDKLWIALAISVAMNTIFAPVFMTFHKITDTHILDCGGSPRSLLTPIPMTRIITHLNWDAQWNFVFKKTIPFFWYPAHTITFLLPGEMRVLFAAILGVVLGVLLAIAARMK